MISILAAIDSERLGVALCVVLFIEVGGAGGAGKRGGAGGRAASFATGATIATGRGSARAGLVAEVPAIAGTPPPRNTTAMSK